MPDDDEITADDEEGDNRTPRQCMPDDNIIQFEDHEGAERIPPNCEIPYGKLCLFEESEEILLFNERK